jgi:UDP-N-acetylmuramate dehydrogenase
MGLGGQASYLVNIETKQELIKALNFANLNKLKTIMIGGGSNIIWRDEGFKGLVIVNGIRGFEIENEDDEGADILIGAGENWDSVVDKAVSLSLSGIECLSLIPGSAGATPVQNVGAYGQEIAKSLVSLEAYDNKSENFVTMLNEDCHFSYRSSCFKKNIGRYYIVSIRLHLGKTHIREPLYKTLSQYLNDHKINDRSPNTIRQAVINIRRSKLPDPKLVKNCGSFFKNPIVSNDKYMKLNDKYKNVPHWPSAKGQIKISAAWLIENAGFSNYSDPISGIAVWKNHPLVLVNERAKKTADLLDFKKILIDSVKEKFDIKLDQEPILLP